MRKYPKGDPSAWIRRVAKPGDVVIDGGANRGNFARVAAELVGPEGAVYAVEPDVRCAADMEATVTGAPHVRYLPYALSSKHGLTTLTKGRVTTQSSLVRDAVADKDGTVEVQTITLDTITDRRVAAVKLDLQGGEPAALAGAEQLLLSCPHWCVEFWPWALGKQTEFLLWVFRALEFTAATLDETRVDYDELLAWSQSELSPSQHINLSFSR